MQLHLSCREPLSGSSHSRGEDSVRQVRREFEQSIAPTFCATVEHMTGRRVIGFLSETHIDPPLSVELFRLAPSA